MSKWQDDRGGSLIGPDGGVQPDCRRVYLPWHHKVQKKISSGTGSSG